MTKHELFEQIKKKKSFLCVGLDTDIHKIPSHLLKSSEDPIFNFNRAIIDATAEFCVAYKPNLAFYESAGTKGWESLARTVNYLKNNYPEQFLIADAKRGDIGNTSQKYAETFFENLNFDAITLHPYMGKDTVVPFLNYKNKWVVLLILTSNKSATDFQLLRISENGDFLFEKILKDSLQWGNEENMMYVVGAMQAEMLKKVRAIAPHHFLLIPGIGSQGGNLEEVASAGLNEVCGLLVNSSRQIIYASSEKDFASAAQAEAKKLQTTMECLLKQHGIF